MKLLFFIPVWKRPQITEICFMGINRLRESFDIDAFAVISEEEMKPLCDKYNVKYCMYKNHPLGEKKNYGIGQSLQLEWDYLIEIGSDDLVKDDLIKSYMPFFGHRPTIGASEFIHLNSKTGECRSFKSMIHGAATAISRQTVERFKKLWDDSRSIGLDKNVTNLLVTNGVMGKRVTGEPKVIDIKSDVNIWKFNKRGVKYPFDQAMKGLSEQEITAIKRLNVAA